MMNTVNGFGVADSDESASVRATPVVSTQYLRDAVVLTVAGEIDMTTAPALEDAVRQSLAEGPAMLVIDLSGAEFFSSAGIAVLMLAHRNESGVALRVVATDRIVLRPLELTGLTDDLAIYDSLDTALRA
ncbi:MAG TPA: STAS domain-containing protein [Pseudonocardiaceae bacterium]